MPLRVDVSLEYLEMKPMEPLGDRCLWEPGMAAVDGELAQPWDLDSWVRGADQRGYAAPPIHVMPPHTPANRV
jgi:hypothetical protein